MAKIDPPADLSDDTHPAGRYAEMISGDLRRLHQLADLAERNPISAQSLSTEWAGIFDKTYKPARPLLLPVALRTFETATDPHLKRAAARQLVDLVFFHADATSEETLSTIRGTLTQVHHFAARDGDRKLIRHTTAKLAEFDVQMQSLLQPL